MAYFQSPTISFEAALRDITAARPEARARAAYALGDLSVPDEPTRAAVLGALVQALADASPGVRAAAAGSLGVVARAGDGEVLAALERALGDLTDAVRQHAVIALGSMGDARAIAALVAAASEGPADVRFQAVTSLVELDPQAAYAPACAALGDRDDEVVSAAALALGAIGDGRAAGLLAAKLDHVAPRLGFDLAYAMAQLGDGRGRSHLVRGLEVPELAWDAVDALGRLATSEDCATLLAFSQRRRGVTEATVRAAEVVMRLGQPPQRDAAWLVIEAALRAWSERVRGVAVAACVAVLAQGPREQRIVAALTQLRRSRRGRTLADQIDEALAALPA